MKRLITTWMMSLLMVLTFPAMAAMSTSKMRQHSRFLTDRMAYELNLSSSQYDDVYEVNYDFLSRTRYLIDDVTAGYTSALDEYYDYLDVRNDDLRWILTSSQYRRFLEKEYFYRPIYTTTSGSWGFRIYRIYTDVSYFYFGKPSHYSTYKGAHYRSNFNNVSYYKSHHEARYKNHDVYHGDFTMGKTMKKEHEQKKEQKRENPNNPKSGSYKDNGNGNGNVSRPSNTATSSSSSHTNTNKNSSTVNKTSTSSSNKSTNSSSKNRSTTTSRSSRTTSKSSGTTSKSSSSSGKSTNNSTRSNNSGRTRTR